MNKFLTLAVLGVALFLGGCLTTQGDSAVAALKQGVTIIKKAHFDAAMTVETVRCKRPLELVLKMADVRGENWFNAYVASCPELQAVIKRIAGAAALNQGFKIVPVGRDNEDGK